MIKPKRTKSAKFIAKHWTDRNCFIYDKHGRFVITAFRGTEIQVIRNVLGDPEGCSILIQTTHRTSTETTEEFFVSGGKLIKKVLN